MTTYEKINADLKEAMTQRDELRVSVLRLLKSALHNQEIAKKKKDKGLTEEEVLAVISSEAKKRRDSIEAYKKGQRDDLVSQEENELKLVMAYLPQQLTEEEVTKVVQDILASFGDGPKQFGQVMGKAMAKLKGRTDGNLVGKVVKDLLAS
jgi:hypothetical protein